MTKTCEYCGTDYEAIRNTSKYCCNACRTKSYRQRNGIPFPDFNKISPPTKSNEAVKQLTLLREEMNTLLLEEISFEESFRKVMQNHEKALEKIRNSGDTWSRDYAARKWMEMDFLRNELARVRNKRKLLQGSIGKLEQEVNRINLETKGLVLSADQLKKMKFSYIELSGKFKALLGKPQMNTFFGVTGPSKSGKTTFSLQFANELKSLGKVIYFYLDENIGMNFQKKITDFQIRGIDIGNTGKKEEIEFIIKRGDYSFIIIDSLNKVALYSKDLAYFKRKYPDKSFIIIYGFNFPMKSGIVDIKIDVREGIASSNYSFQSYKGYEIFK